MLDQDLPGRGIAPPKFRRRKGTLFAWFTTLATGLTLVAANDITENYGVNTQLVGTAAIGASAVGISTHISDYLQKPGYNLWEKLRPILLDHKTAVAFGIGGLLTFDPFLTFAIAGTGLSIDLYFEEQLGKIESTALSAFARAKALLHWTRETARNAKDRVFDRFHRAKETAYALPQRARERAHDCVQQIQDLRGYFPYRQTARENTFVEQPSLGDNPQINVVISSLPGNGQNLRQRRQH